MADKDHFNEKDRETSDAAPMDNPEQVKTDKKTLDEMHEEEMNVDSIPLEDLKQDMQDESKPRETKHDSGSDKE